MSMKITSTFTQNDMEHAKNDICIISTNFMTVKAVKK